MDAIDSWTSFCLLPKPGALFINVMQCANNLFQSTCTLCETLFQACTRIKKTPLFSEKYKISSVTFLGISSLALDPTHTYSRSSIQPARQPA